MRSRLYSIALGAGTVMLASGAADAAPTAGIASHDAARNIHKVQEFGIYIGPRYGYRNRYWDYDYGYGYGYGYGYNPRYDYGPRRYYYGNNYRYRGDNRRTFRELQRQAP